MRFTPRSLSFVIFLGILLLSQFTAQAQQANFELAERFTTQKMEKLIGSTDVIPNWIEDSDDFWYEWEDARGTNWFYVDIEAKNQRELFDREELAGLLSEEFKRPFNATDLELKGFDFDEDKELFTFHVDSIEFEWSVQTNNLVKGDSLEPNKREPWANWSPDSTWVVFAKNHNLYLMSGDTSDTTEHQLTTDGERWFSYQWAQGDTATDKKMSARIRWFDDEKKFYVQRTDNRKVDELWVINNLGKRPSLETYKYAMPGEEEVGIDYVEVFDVSSKERVIMNTDKWEDQNLSVDFSDVATGDLNGRSSEVIYIERLNRAASEFELLKGNTETGEVEVIISERSEPYWNWRFQDADVINNGEEYLWWSERSGWGHLYRYDAEGNLKNQITSGNFVAGNIMKIDTAAQTIFFEGYGREAGNEPYYEHLYSVKFDGSRMTHLTPEHANHRIFSSPEGNYFVDNMSRVDMPTKAVVRDGSGKVIINLQEVNIDRATELGWKYPEKFKVKAADGVTDIYGVMWKPFDFDSTKNYPVISYVYPGPQVEPYPIRFGPSRHQTLAQVGFVVVAFGNRGGTPLRNRYYHTYGYGDLRDYPLADNRYGLEQLIGRYDFIDGENVGIYGHSGGGFMSTAALLSHPDFYDVAVSSAGNHDNNVYNRWWSETHNGVKETVKKVTEMGEDSVEVEREEVTFEGPIETNISLASNLQGKLLLVHGSMDNNVHPANTLRLVEELIKEGKRFDLMMLPSQRHGFRGASRAYFERMMWYYFAEHLLGDRRTNVNFNIPEELD
ncbi:MAG: DPP IV N-terminal domain-containing protein [bacterium]|nr:DPP IV N-terminal domain-containing protein [bacterium]